MHPESRCSEYCALCPVTAQHPEHARAGPGGTAGPESALRHASPWSVGFRPWSWRLWLINFFEKIFFNASESLERHCAQHTDPYLGIRLNMLINVQRNRSADRDLHVFRKKNRDSSEERSRLEQILANLEMH